MDELPDYLRSDTTDVSHSPLLDSGHYMLSNGPYMLSNGHYMLSNGPNGKIIDQRKWGRPWKRPERSSAEESPGVRTVSQV